MECPGTPTPQRGNKKQTSAHSARVCSFPLRPSTSHIKPQRTRARHLEINTQGKLWSSLLNDTKQHSLVFVHCFHCELSRTSLSWIILRCHCFLPGKVAVWIRLCCGCNFISTQHRGERSPETYHAAGRSQLLSVQRCTLHYPLEGHVTRKTPPNQTEYFAVTNPVCPQNMNMTSFSSNRSLLSPRRQPLNSKSSLNRPTAVTGPFGPSSGSHVDSGSEFYQILWKRTQIQVTDSSFQQ